MGFNCPIARYEDRLITTQGELAGALGLDLNQLVRYVIQVETGYQKCLCNIDVVDSIRSSDNDVVIAIRERLKPHEQPSELVIKKVGRSIRFYNTRCEKSII